MIVCMCLCVCLCMCTHMCLLFVKNQKGVVKWSTLRISILSLFPPACFVINNEAMYSSLKMGM